MQVCGPSAVPRQLPWRRLRRECPVLGGRAARGHVGTLDVGEVLGVLHLDDGRGRQVVAGVGQHGQWDRCVADVNGDVRGLRCAANAWTGCPQTSSESVHVGSRLGASHQAAETALPA